MPGFGPKSPRARAVFEELYNSSTYPYVKENYDTNADNFRTMADNYVYPDGINLVTSKQIDEVRKEIDGYTGPSGYTTVRGSIVTKFGACSAADKAEIRGSRDWRDLVELRFTGAVPGNSALDRADDIKTVLNIPQ